MFFYFHVLNGFAFCWQVLGTPTREEIQCMNWNYTVFVFCHIKAHPWHKVCEIYLSHYTHPASHCILSELGRFAACPCSSWSSCCWGTWWWLERPTSSPSASSQWVVLLHLNEWMNAPSIHMEIWISSFAWNGRYTGCGRAGSCFRFYVVMRLISVIQQGQRQYHLQLLQVSPSIATSK